MRGRLLLLLVLAAVWLGAILIRLYDLQVRRHVDFAERAERQQQRRVVLDAPRGTIYDAQGRELAVSIEVDSVAVDPSQLKDPENPAQTRENVHQVATTLGRTLSLDAERMRKLHADLDSDRAFAWVQRKLDPPLAARVRALKLPGVLFLSESKRYYPLRTLAAQILGYVGTDESGLAGLEFLYDGVIASAPGRRTVLRDARYGTVLDPNLESSAPQPGRDLHLTLDATIQQLAEQELEAAVVRHHAKGGSVVVMNPDNGAILAMASYPTFDPNHFADYPASYWRNPVVMDAYEPGSTFKMVTLAAALEADAVRPSDLIDCQNGGISLYGVHISDHKSFPVLSAQEVIARSSNVGAIKIGLRAGARQLFSTIQAFGFGRRTGIDLPSENPGLLLPVDRWSAIAPAYISFGQGMALTPMQLVTAFAVIANGGHLLKPYIVAAESDAEGHREPVGRREVVRLPISPSNVATLHHILQTVVEEGTGKAAALPGYGAAGKTGTAQKAIGGKYSHNKFIASFVGFAPVARPALVVSVMIDEPWPLYHGGDVAAPVFQAIVGQALLYLGIPPQRELEPPPPPDEDQVLLAQQAAPGEEAANPPSSVPLPPGTIPDFTGLSARIAVTRSSALGLRPELFGHGLVTHQEPAPGTPLELAAGVLELWLSTEVL